MDHEKGAYEGIHQNRLIKQIPRESCTYTHVAGIIVFFHATSTVSPPDMSLRVFCRTNDTTTCVIHCIYFGDTVLPYLPRLTKGKSEGYMLCPEPWRHWIWRGMLGSVYMVKQETALPTGNKQQQEEKGDMQNKQREMKNIMLCEYI